MELCTKAVAGLQLVDSGPDDYLSMPSGWTRSAASIISHASADQPWPST